MRSMPTPLGIFRRFVVDRDGEHATAWISRSASAGDRHCRLHALAHRIGGEHRRAAGGLLATNIWPSATATAWRMRCASCNGCGYSTGGPGEPGQTPIISSTPTTCPLAQEQLRDAFTILDDALSALRQTYRAGLG